MVSLVKKYNSLAMEHGKSAAARARRDVVLHPSKFLISLVSAVAALIMFTLQVALTWWVFLLFLMYNWNRRIVEAVAAALVLTTLVLFGMGHKPWALNTLIVAYSFVVMAITLRLVPYVRDPYFTKLNLFS